MKIIESKIARTSVMRKIELDRETLLQLLASHTDCGDIPSYATVYVRVPGGGDWSNMDLDINDAAPVIITWIEIEDNGDV